MRMFGRTEAGKRDDGPVADVADRRDAGARWLTVEMHGAGAALRKAAAEVRIVEAEIVSKRVEQRHVRVGFDGLNLAVDVKGILLVHGQAFLHKRNGIFVGPAMCRRIPNAAASAGANDILKSLA